VSAAAGQLHLELVDDQEIIVGRVLEIDVPNRLRASVIPIRGTLRHRAFEQQGCGALVDLHEAVPRRLLQIPDGMGDPRLVQPGSAVAEIEPAKRRFQPPFENDLPEAFTLGQLRHVDIPLDPLPAHPPELFAEGFLDEVVFPLDLAHACPTLSVTGS